VLDACQRVVDILDGGERCLQALKMPSILVSEEIYPTDIVALDRRLLLGIVTSHGAVSAHAAIIARNMGLPFVVMAGDDFLAACCGQSAALDGEAATVYLAPDEVTKARFAQRRNMAYRHSQTLDMLRGTPCRTRDGVHVQLYANCFSAEDVALSVSMGAQGIGLLRSELSLLAGASARELDEQSQYLFYKNCLETADGRPVFVSTCDLGAGKAAAGVVDSVEANPALGLRGVRYSLAHKNFFAQQLLALLRAAVHGPLSLVLPMVAAPADVTAVRAELEKAKDLLRLRGDVFAEKLPLGVMVETPAAALQAQTLAGMADFFHIGTNDLAQYTMAADRTTNALQGYLRMPNAPVLRLVELVVQAAAAAQIPVCVCGENAADPCFALELLRCGIETFSVGPRQLTELKAELLECTVHPE
ncbi:MAG: putative PEP-binding protein, partial [Ruthenibacterium sp.]